MLMVMQILVPFIGADDDTSNATAVVPLILVRLLVLTMTLLAPLHFLLSPIK